MFFAFYYNNLFPEQIFHISRSIEIILGPIIGGVGTLFGPILGAVVLTLLAEGITEVLRGSAGRSRASSRCSTASCCCCVVMFLPHGIWPPLARTAGMDCRRRAERCGGCMTALLEVDRVESFRGLRAVHDVSFDVPRARSSR